MKYTVIAACLSVILMNCTGKKTYSRYELFNACDYTIEIRSFIRTAPEEGVQKSIELLPQNEWISIEFETTRGRRISLFDMELFGGDSLAIVFDDNRYIGNSGFTIEANPDLYSHNTYQCVKYDDQKTALRYVFTEADWERAVPLE